MTNLGPLTTVFTPNGTDCTSTFLGENDTNTWIEYGAGGYLSTACLPSGFRASEAYYYSPGICPSGYTSACHTLHVSAGGSVTETEATCCPTHDSYTCRESRGNDPFGCLSVFTGPKTFAVSTYYFHADSNGFDTEVAAGTTTIVWSDSFVLAYGPVVRVKAGDTLITSVDSSTSMVVSSTSTSTTSAISLATPTMPVEADTNSSNSPGLSTGAAVGIAIGCTLAAILLFLAVFTMIRRRRKRLAQPEPAADTAQVETAQTDKPELESQHQQQCYEFSGERQPYPYELNGERE
ncbi:hypothetical protein F4821DRAFT_249206 [Hypoxylon rubiginosum]|uniref:Uncharacterized protein n=1 Tax=Hypoxylon rubiginosum TaxID=110542 RepID=A0ACC0CM70_9PEZI|nr:hypothetical protein F4821DRAFT_249206 [Hypoxylon rubiginosum]